VSVKSELPPSDDDVPLIQERDELIDDGVTGAPGLDHDHGFARL